MADYGKRAKKGDKKISQRLLNGLRERAQKSDNLVSAGGLSSGPSGEALFDLQPFQGMKIVRLGYAVLFVGNAGAGAAAGTQSEEVPFGAYWGVGSESAYNDEQAGVSSPAVVAKNLLNDGVTDGDRSNNTRRIRVTDAYVHEIRDNELKETGEVVQVINLSSYTIEGGWALVAPVDENSSLYMIVTDLANFTHHVKSFARSGNNLSQNGVPSGQPEWTIEEGKGKVLRLAQLGSAGTYEWCEALDVGLLKGAEFGDESKADVFIKFPGKFEVEWGLDIDTVAGNWPVIGGSTNVAAQTGLPSHQHTYANLGSFEIKVILFFNFKPRDDDDPITWDNFHEYTIQKSTRYIAKRALTPVESYEFKDIVTHSWHHDHNEGTGSGNMWARVRIGVAVNECPQRQNVSPKCFIRVPRVWARIRPVGIGFQNSVGMNHFTGTKDPVNNPLGFKVLGGGTLPILISDDGVKVT